MRRVGVVLLKASVTILLTLLVFELAVRAIPLYPDTFEVPDPLYGWRMPTNSSGSYLNILCLGEFTTRVTINSQGLHDVEHSYEPPPDVNRILFMGDSMVAGFEVPLEQTFYRRLENLLNENGDGRYEVIAAGHRGYSTDLELLFYQHEASRYAADTVVLVIQPGNDIEDNHPGLRLPGTINAPYFTLEGDQLTHHAAQNMATSVNAGLPSINPLHDALYQISYLYRLLYRRVSAVQGAGQTFATVTDTQLLDWTEQAYDDAWAVTQALVARFRDEVQSAGGQFAVMVTSSHLLIGERGDETYNRVYAMLDELEITYLKLQPVFAASDERLEYACDRHWTPAGHEVVAQQLADFLSALKI
jgi:hypothetical protein